MSYKHSKAIEEKLQQIRGGKPSPTTTKRKKLSRFILLADIVLILMIFFYFNNRDEEAFISKSYVIVGGITYRVSALQSSDRLILTTSFESEKSKDIFFNGNVAYIFVSFKGIQVLKITHGVSINELHLKNDDAKNHISSVYLSRIENALKAKQIVFKRKRGLFSFGEEKIPLTIRVEFNEAEKIELEITCEVELDNE